MRASGRVGSKWYDEARRLSRRAARSFPCAAPPARRPARRSRDGLTGAGGRQRLGDRPSRRVPPRRRPGRGSGGRSRNAKPRTTRHEDRKGEDPEERLGLADELEDAGLRQRRRAGCGAHSSRSSRPVSEMKTSSSVARCVESETSLAPAPSSAASSAGTACGERGGGEEPPAVALPALADARDRREQRVGDRRLGRELDDVRARAGRR